MSDVPIERPKAYTAPWWQIHAWGIGGIASYFMYEQFYLINNIHTTVYKVNPTLVGAILALPRLVDGLLDPILGHWSDNMRSRFGRRRPFLLVSAIVGAFLASSMFWMSPEWSQWLKGLVLGFCAVTLFTACGTYDMSYTALGYELSDDYAERSRVQAIKGVYWSVVGIVGGYVIWMAPNLHLVGDFLFGAPPHSWLGAWPGWRKAMLVTGWFTDSTDKLVGYRVISGVVSFLILFSVIFPFLWSRERYLKINRKHVNLWKAFIATMKCRPFVIILIINFTKGAGTLSRNLFFFVGTYYVCFGDDAKYTKIMNGDFAVWGLGFAIVVWLITKRFTKFMGKRTAFILSTVVGLLEAIATLIVAVPGNVMMWFYVKLIFLAVTMLLNASWAGIMPDICDIDELEYGERREGMFAAVQSFVNKMEISVMSLLGGILLTSSGFKAEVGPTQPHDVLENLRLMAFGPLIIIAAVALLLSFFMPITHEMMENVRAQLDARHAAAGVPGVPPEAAEASPA